MKAHENRICKICDKEFSSCDARANHEKAHMGKRDFLCTHCGKTFISKASLKYHVNVHEGLTTYKCKECGERFRTHSKN